jgi:hypothetical protein
MKINKILFLLFGALAIGIVFAPGDEIEAPIHDTSIPSAAPKIQPSFEELVLYKDPDITVYMRDYKTDLGLLRLIMKHCNSTGKEEFIWNPRIFLIGYSVRILDSGRKQPTLSDLKNQDTKFIKSTFIASQSNSDCIWPDEMFTGNGYNNDNADKTPLSLETICRIFQCIHETVPRYLGNPDLGKQFSMTMAESRKILDPLQDRFQAPPRTRTQFNFVIH